ncbi:hypothetical protein CW736_08000 [Nonlabens sp. MB-3u-79]|uniref:hypothetical protein n=1 Tax=Nonlabens sp. MB-3u-79 TaxID=2058134 RepID=UPI000C31597F|nr:hypothetical protein [Nonlabens sp. MB-3u-79]AUC79327.1 hypothetical protein CW736_08000 [Nonlabens sp. MB-3u-79]
MLLLFLLCSSSLIAQVGLNTATPDESSSLDVVSSDTGILIPRLTLTGTGDMSTITNGNIESLLVYNTATVSDVTPGFYYWNAAATDPRWVRLVTNDTESKDWNLEGNTGTTSGNDFIGTTDAQDLAIKTNNTLFFRFTQKGQLDFLNTGESVFIGEDAGEANDISLTTRSTFVGSKSGASNTSGADNSFFGANSGQSNTTGEKNSFFGSQSGVANVDGSKNSFFGERTGIQNTSGSDNSFFGQTSGNANTTGLSNTFLGSASGLNSSVGDENVFVGATAGRNNAAGNSNTYLGATSGVLNTGNNNVFIGFGAGNGETTASNTLIIQNDPNDDPLIYGKFDTDEVEVRGGLKISDIINLTPRATTPTSPSAGDIYYDSGTNKVRLWNGSVWENLN